MSGPLKASFQAIEAVEGDHLLVLEAADDYSGRNPKPARESAYTMNRERPCGDKLLPPASRYEDVFGKAISLLLWFSCHRGLSLVAFQKAEPLAMKQHMPCLMEESEP
jgi:hypothetical protein